MVYVPSMHSVIAPRHTGLELRLQVGSQFGNGTSDIIHYIGAALGLDKHRLVERR